METLYMEESMEGCFPGVDISHWVETGTDELNAPNHLS